jgi:YD repeat-containing protein
LTLSSGNLVNITNPDGGVRTFTYDGNHLLTRDQYGPNLESNYAYTGFGTVGTITQGAITVGGVSNPTRVTVNPAILTGVGTTPGVGKPYGSTTDGLGSTRRLLVDPEGRPMQSIAAEGTAGNTTYSDGYVTTQADAQGRVTTYTNDTEGYPTRIDFPDGTWVTYSYQSSPKAVTSMTDQRGFTTTFTYNAGGQLVSSTDALTNTTTYTYVSGLLQTSIDALNRVTTYGYDALRRLVTITNPLNETTTYTYDTAGNVRSITDALNRTTTYSYDAMGRATVVEDVLGNKRPRRMM